MRFEDLGYGSYGEILDRPLQSVVTVRDSRLVFFDGCVIPKFQRYVVTGYSVKYLSSEISFKDFAAFMAFAKVTFRIANREHFTIFSGADFIDFLAGKLITRPANPSVPLTQLTQYNIIMDLVDVPLNLIGTRIQMTLEGMCLIKL